MPEAGFCAAADSSQRDNRPDTRVARGIPIRDRATRITSDNCLLGGAEQLVVHAIRSDRGVSAVNVRDRASVLRSSWLVSLSWREFSAQAADEFVDVGLFAELLGPLLFLALRGDLEPVRYAAQEFEHQRHSLFGEHADLQVQVVAFIALAAHSVLRDEHECRDEHALERNDEREEPIGGKGRISAPRAQARSRRSRPPWPQCVP